MSTSSSNIGDASSGLRNMRIASRAFRMGLTAMPPAMAAGIKFAHADLAGIAGISAQIRASQAQLFKSLPDMSAAFRAIQQANAIALTPEASAALRAFKETLTNHTSKLRAFQSTLFVGLPDVNAGIRALQGIMPSADAELVGTLFSDIEAETEEIIYEKECPKESEIWIPNVDAELLVLVRQNPERIYTLTPRRFEELVASIFRNQGFEVELTPASKDGGYDIIAVQRSEMTGMNRYLVECKRYAPRNPVGIGIVNALFGVVCSERATKGVVVTSSYFTSGAQKFQCLNTNRLQLSDYCQLIEWIKRLEAP